MKNVFFLIQSVFFSDGPLGKNSLFVAKIKVQPRACELGTALRDMARIAANEGGFEHRCTELGPTGLPS